MRTDHAALKWMVHMDGTHGRLARRRLSLAEFDYVVQTRPGASNHAAYTMLRILTRAEDDGAITDAVLCLALPNSSAACQRQPQAEGGLLSLLTLLELLEFQADDGRRKEARATMDGNDKSWFREDANRIMVRTAPWDGTEQVYVPTHMRYGVLMLGHYLRQPEMRKRAGCTRRCDGGFIGSLWWCTTTLSWQAACSARGTASASDVRRNTSRRSPRRSC